jgi:glyoxylase-like metal-dependent hydrolase (beta-lactamase superfamily II)
VRAVALHQDVLVATSDIWQTTCTIVRGGPAEAFVIDSVVLPGELEALPPLCSQAGFVVVGLLVTHADWDHLLGRSAFPEAPIGVSEASAVRLRTAPGQAQRELRAFDDQWYVERAPLGLGAVQELPVPGQCDVGERTLELYAAAGHTSDGTAVLAEWAGVLCVGDYLSPVEIPMISPGGSLAEYRSTLAALAPAVERAEVVVPGHGRPADRETALRLLDEDVEYLDALERGEERPALPKGRDTREQRRIHAENVARVAG